MNNLDYYLLELADELTYDFLSGKPIADDNQYLLDCTTEEKPLVIAELQKLALDLAHMSKRVRALSKLSGGDYSGESYLRVIKNNNNPDYE